MFYYGIVENRQDPLALGRCQVRIAGLHTHDKSLLPTNDLPWSTPVSPVTSASMHGIGHTPLGPVEGTTVIITFADGDRMQQPIMFGAIGGISSSPLPIDLNDQGQIGAQAPVTEVQLESQEEEVNGTQLTLVDYQTGSTQLTSVLRADMRVEGFGIQTGTRIVSIDSGNQITISTPVNDYGRNIITFKPAPTNLGALSRSQEFLSNETPTSVPAFGNSQAVRPVPSQTNSEIPIVPPDGTADSAAATEGIRALIAACDQVGLTTKEQKCALLGIVGGESGWVPKQESYNYSPSRLQQVYSFATAADVEQYARAPSKNVSRFDFFSWAYGPTTRGNGFLGNETDADGGRYFGRGFIQLTGKSNYRRYARLAREMGLNADIENNPELLNTDINVSAIIAALYLKDRVSANVSSTAHPEYFYAAKRSVGYNTQDIAARKLRFYEYFYGDGGNSSISRSADTPPVTPLSEEEAEFQRQVSYHNDFMLRYFRMDTNLSISPDQTAAIEARKEEALQFRDRAVKLSGFDPRIFVYDEDGRPFGIETPEQTSTPTEVVQSITDPSVNNVEFLPGPSQRSYETGAINNGFRDPNSKYPRPQFLNETDTNRLARGIIEGTVVPLKDATRITGLKRGIVGGTWDQPQSPYGAQYPYNHVYETESGHIQEFDDTPGQERIHQYHRSGTYTEIDANGTQVNYIVGDNYVLMERNGNIHVAGECNITIDGQTNIMVQSDANIEVAQNANIEVGNNINVNAHRDVDITAGGDMRVNVGGDYSVTAANIFNYTAGNMKSQADSGMHLQSGDLMYISSKAGLQLHDATQVNIESSGTMDLLAGSVLNVDYTQGHFGEGATGAGIADTLGNGLVTESRQDSDGNEDWTFTPVEEGNPINNSFPPIVPPERRFEELTAAETPEDWDTPSGRYISNQERLNGDPNAQPAVAAEDPVLPSGGRSSTVDINCSVIDGTIEFTNDFQLSENFTLGMLIDGGVNGRHRLVDQMLSDGNTNRLYTAQEIVCNMAHIAQNVLEPALAFLPEGINGYGRLWFINSGYRLRGVIRNESVRSQHPKGQAIDIGLYGSGIDEKIRKTYDTAVQLEKVIPYDQLILEYRNSSAPTTWIHVSYNPDGLRRMAFTMVNDSTFRRNEQGQPEGFVLVNDIPRKGT